MGRQSGCDLIKCLRSLTSCAVRVSVGAVIWSLDWRGWHTRCLWPSGLASCLHADTGKEQSETTPSTAPSFPQERVGRGRCAGGGNLPLSCNLILQVAACDFCSHSRGGDNRMAWMQGGGITGAHFIYLFIGAHFKGCPPHPEFRCCSCLLYLTRMDRSRREGGVFEKQNPTGLNILFAITYDIVSHTLWYLSHYYSFAHLFFHSLRSMQHVTHENAVWHVTFLTPRCGLPKISGKSFFLS